MSAFSKIYKLHRLKKKVAQLEMKKRVYTMIASDDMMSPSIRCYAYLKLVWLNSNSSITHIQKRCLLTGRKSIQSPYNLSKNQLRELIDFGFVPGILKRKY